MKENGPVVFVSGHRNPDIDSIAGAAALAELRRRQGVHAVAVCPGAMPERARYLFERFHFPAPEMRQDFYVRVGDVMDRDVPKIPGGTSLYSAVQSLRGSGYSRLPVVGEDGAFLGMLSPLALLSQLLNVGAEGGLAGRAVNTSLRLIAELIASPLGDAPDADVRRNFMVYVGAMGIESFDSHLPAEGDLVVIVGDRPDIHLRALQHKIRILIVTGGKPVEPLILAEAERGGVAVLRTDLDSATVIRRLKFSVPVESCIAGAECMTLPANSRIRAVGAKVLNQPEDAIPVLDAKKRLAGVLLKRHIGAEPPFKLIFVDHNELAQSLPGAEELPLVEIVDHHRIGMVATSAPIKFTGDVVGSSCTLIAAMFKSSGESITGELAGILLGGIVSDTLNLVSPTTAPLDRKMVEWLEKLSPVKGAELMKELSRIASPLAASPAREVIDADRKSYEDGRFRFALSQVEESNLSHLLRRREELCAEMRDAMRRESLHFIALMVTDTVRANSKLMILGDESVIEALPYNAGADGIFDLPGIVSRKKQLLPQILALTNALNRL
ncbi:MAG: DHH family phosphoesterase [Victivallaceae bacterium]|nr:DHH family phosphoesterase [Victivallaceae bacterium]